MNSSNVRGARGPTAGEDLPDVDIDDDDDLKFARAVYAVRHGLV